MKMPIEKMTEAELLQRYPIRGKTPGWFYMETEVTVGSWVVEGSDAYGRLVSRGGIDPEQLRADCETDAAKINKETERFLKG